MRTERREALRAAADSLAKRMRKIAILKTRKTAEAVRVAEEGEGFTVAAGKPGGPYGWEPIEALMFDDNKRHPLFGNKAHWYHQGYYSITEATVVQGGDDAAEAYADEFLRGFGFTE